MVSIVAVSGTALGVPLSLDGDASPINAVPGNSESVGLLISVTDPKGMAISGLGEDSFEVDATIVAPGGALVDIVRVAEASRASGFYIVEIVPTTHEGTQYVWKEGVYLFAVTVQKGADRGQEVISLDLRDMSALEMPASVETLPPEIFTDGMPDLRVTQIIAEDPSFENDGNEASVPLTVTIKNFGATTEDRFKIGTDVIVEDGTRFAKPFTVPGQVDIWYPWQNGLGAGEGATFTGNLYIGHPSGSSLLGQSASIIATVDSCSGDEFMPDYCRVEEINETNNEMETSIELKQSMKILPLTQMMKIEMTKS